MYASYFLVLNANIKIFIIKFSKKLELRIFSTHVSCVVVVVVVIEV